MEIVSYLLEKAMEQNTLAELLLSPVTGGFFSNGAPSVHLLRTSETPSVYFGETPLLSHRLLVSSWIKRDH